jgi:dipeptidyl aminopeptidase/acylaminoacyl peptidase
MRKQMRMKLFAALVLTGGVLTAGVSARGDDPPRAGGAKFALSVDSIMRGSDLVGFPPSGLRWSGDSERLYFEWRKPGEDEPATYVVSRAGGAPRKLGDDERKLAPPPMGRWDRAHRRVVFADEGDIILVDSIAGTRRNLTRTTGAESNPRWARHDTHVTFTRDGNLFIVPVQTVGESLVAQLTDVAVKRPEPRLTDSQKFLKEEELKLIEYVREQAERKKKQEDRRERDALPKVELKEGQSATDLALSPDEDHIFLIVSERAQGAKVADVPSYVTESSYAELITARPFVGDAQEKRLLAVLSLSTRKTVWADAGFAGDGRRETTPESGSTSLQARPEPAGGTSLPPSREASADRRSLGGGGQARPDPSGPATDQAAQDQKADQKPARDVRWAMPVFSSDGKHAVGAVRASDNKDRWLVLVDSDTGKCRVLDRLHDDAWIREVGGGGGFGAATAPFLGDDRTVWFLSERDGWMHLYTLDVSAARAEATQRTSGKWEVTAAQLSADRKKFYLTTTEAHPGERHLYSLPLEGGALTRITTTTGSHETEVAPDDSTLGVIYSYSNKPPEVYLTPNRPGAAAAQVTTTPTEEWRSFAWADPQLVTFKARDGAGVYARLYTPEMMGARRNPARPGVVFVHGAGYAQNAHKYWASYYREYMFHNLLASRGYVVLDVDYRASSGYGRDWRTAIYRHMGGKDLEDIVDGAKYLAAEQKVDPRRIGVYGGSYGGFITLMAMFTTPDVFAAGAALRPVTDWAHYNHGYTSNILNEPQKDAAAYRRSSPIYFAQNLKGALLICHGMVDTNVHFQDSVRLAQRLIELRKDHWELAVYPVENHGFTEETSWADEYKRILKLFEDNLRRNR